VGFTFLPMDETSARAVLAWRYEGPYKQYNTDPDEMEDTVRVLLDPQNAYYRIEDEAGNLAGYCCFGPDARVPGGNYRGEALDLGLGVRPDLTGRGRGLAYVEAALDFARWTFGPTEFRVVVAEWNKRALRVWQKAGFLPVQTFARSQDGMAFVILKKQENRKTGEQEEEAQT
jgi:ribosomal-protein-alanine N-acetyltransferase